MKKNLSKIEGLYYCECAILTEKFNRLRREYSGLTEECICLSKKHYGLTKDHDELKIDASGALYSFLRLRERFIELSIECSRLSEKCLESREVYIKLKEKFIDISNECAEFIYKCNRTIIETGHEELIKILDESKITDEDRRTALHIFKLVDKSFQ